MIISPPFPPNGLKKTRNKKIEKTTLEIRIMCISSVKITIFFLNFCASASVSFLYKEKRNKIFRNVSTFKPLPSLSKKYSILHEPLVLKQTQKNLQLELFQVQPPYCSSWKNLQRKFCHRKILISHLNAKLHVVNRINF